jgi:hypothetical protein
MASSCSIPAPDERLRDHASVVKLVYILLREDGPLGKSEIVERTAVSGETVRTALKDLEATLEDEFSRWRAPDDLRRVVCDIEPARKSDRGEEGGRDAHSEGRSWSEM